MSNETMKPGMAPTWGAWLRKYGAWAVLAVVFWAILIYGLIYTFSK